MKKISSISALAVVVMLVASPFIAISRVWKDYIFILAGLAILALSVLIRKELHQVLRVIHGAEEIKSDTYVEKDPQ